MIDDPGHSKSTPDERWAERAKKWTRPSSKKEREAQRAQRVLEAGGLP